MAHWCIFNALQMPFRAENKPGTLNPDFFTLWEKDIAFPEESRLEIGVWSAHESLLEQVDDAFLGSTTIDLEERWAINLRRLRPATQAKDRS